MTGGLPVGDLARHNAFSRLVVDSAEPLENADAPHDLRFTKSAGDRRAASAFYCGGAASAPTAMCWGALVVHHTTNVITPAQRAGFASTVRMWWSACLKPPPRGNRRVAGRHSDESLNEIVILDAQTREFVWRARCARKNLGYSLKNPLALGRAIGSSIDRRAPLPHWPEACLKRASWWNWNCA